MLQILLGALSIINTKKKISLGADNNQNVIFLVSISNFFFK